MEHAENLCKSCVGACCKSGLVMQLNQEEVVYLESVGTQLSPVLEARPGRDWLKYSKTSQFILETQEQKVAITHANRLKIGQGFYQLVSDCGNLVLRDGWYQCDAHDDPARPEICKTFTPGSEACWDMRVHEGVTLPEEVPVFIIRH